MDKIKADVKNNTLKKLYLFTGPETYLMDYYINAVRKKFVESEEFNYIKLDKETISTFQETVQSPPIMSEKKLVVVRGEDICDELKDYDTLISDVIKDVPLYTCVIFSSPALKKNSKLYKILSENCTVCTFDRQRAADVIKWVSNVAGSKGYLCTKDNSELLCEYAGCDMTFLMNELDKVISFDPGSKEITKDAIEALATRSVESKLFELLDAVLMKNREKAFLIFNELEKEKEDPVYINGALSSNLMGIYEYKLLKRDKSDTGRMGLKPFVARKYASYSTKMSDAFLSKMISRCEEFDENFKSGAISGYTGINMLICEMMI